MSEIIEIRERREIRERIYIYTSEKRDNIYKAHNIDKTYKGEKGDIIKIEKRGWIYMRENIYKRGIREMHEDIREEREKRDTIRERQ